ncbi:MAG: SAM hydrolase/SAM-dependent halogenase family protein [Thermoprotei archaeon]
MPAQAKVKRPPVLHAGPQLDARLMLMAPIVALVTDFGYTDYYAGALKGAIKIHCPECELIDVTHGIPKFDIWSGAFVAYHSFRFLPQGTTLLVVVDPGVGGGRRIIYSNCDGKHVVGPDNGVVYPIVSNCAETFCVDAEEYSGSLTFQARDIMSAVAADLASGKGYPGVPIHDPEPLPGWDEKPKLQMGKLKARIIYHDSYGNLVTNIRSSDFPFKGRAILKSKEGVFNASFSKNYEGAGVLLVPDSYGLIEIALSRSSAREALGLSAGDEVELEEIRSRPHSWTVPALSSRPSKGRHLCLLPVRNALHRSWKLTGKWN